MTLVTEDVPRVPPGERIELSELGSGFTRLVARYGLMEPPDVARALGLAGEQGLEVDPQAASYFLGRPHLIPKGKPGMARWRQRLFVLMARNAQDATEYFGLPRNRVIEIGSQIEL